MDKVRIGIIGCGGIANSKHMPSLKKLPDVEMVAFCDIIVERAEKAAKDGVEAVSDVGKRRARAPFVEEGREAQREHLVAAVAAEDVFRLHPLRRGDGRAQLAHGEGRVQLERRKVVILVGRQRAGRGRVRVFVGVEFDVAAVARLFARDVRDDGARPAAEKVHPSASLV